MSAYAFTTQRKARAYFNAEIAPHVIARYDNPDKCALDQAFTDWLDSLYKAGEISERADRTWTRTND